MTFSEERKHKRKVAVDENRGFNSLYVYYDAAEAIPVGDIKAPLLLVVDAAGNFGDTITDCIRRLSTFQSQRKSLTPWK